MALTSFQCCLGSLRFAGIHLYTVLLRYHHSQGGHLDSDWAIATFLLISFSIFLSQPFCCRVAAVLGIIILLHDPHITKL